MTEYYKPMSTVGGSANNWCQYFKIITRDEILDSAT